MAEKPLLFIDDQRKSVAPFMAMLKRKGYESDFRDHPDQGIKAASHQYGAVFVDYEFANAPDTTGAKVAAAIKARFPLLPVFLMTSKGHDDATMDDSISAGFDAYTPKEIPGERPEHTVHRLQSKIQKMQMRMEQKARAPLQGDAPVEVARRLNALQASCQCRGGKEGKFTQADITEVASIFLMSGRTELDAEIRRELVALRSPQDACKPAAAAAKEKYKITTRSSWTVFFQLMDKKGQFENNALVTRALLIDRGQEWRRVVEDFEPVKKIAEYFHVSLPAPAGTVSGAKY